MVVVEEFGNWNCHGVTNCDYNDCILYLLQGKMRRKWGCKLLIMCLILWIAIFAMWYNTGLWLFIL